MDMKKIFCIFSLAIAMAVTSGCDDFLDRGSFTAYPEDQIITNQEGLALLLNGVYDQFSSSGYYGGLLYLYEAHKSPDFFMRYVNGGWYFRTEGNFNTGRETNGNPLNLWRTCYRVIRNATILIQSIDDASGDITELRRLKGQAYALRAMAYFDLLRCFSFPPKYSCSWGSSYMDPVWADPDNMTDPTEHFTAPSGSDHKYVYIWGVPIVDTMEMGYDILDYEVRRATADECWQKVRDELALAYTLLNGYSGDKGYLSAAAVLALRTRIALYMEDYKSVVTLGETWRQLYESQYSLIPYDSYKTQYYQPFNTESIWELRYTDTDNMGGSSINYWARKECYMAPGSPLDGTLKYNTGYGKLCLNYGNANMGYEILTKYTSENGYTKGDDVRAYLICDLGVAGYDYKSIRRYVGNPKHSVHNIPIVRLPEIYLNLAEAYFQRGDLTKAKDYLSRVTSVRRNEDSPTIGALTDILEERRREFILEGQTYFDYFRTGTTYPTRVAHGALSYTTSVSWTGRYGVVYPIPLAEMNANPAIRTQQNPNYGAWSFGIEVDEDD